MAGAALMTRAVLALAAFYLAGCAHAPAEWSVSNPADRYGWSSRKLCFSLCRQPSSIVRVGVRF